MQSIILALNVWWERWPPPLLWCYRWHPWLPCSSGSPPCWDHTTVWNWANMCLQVPVSVHIFNFLICSWQSYWMKLNLWEVVLLTCNKHQCYKARGSDCALIEHTRDQEDNMMHMSFNTCLLSFGPYFTCSIIYATVETQHMNQITSHSLSLSLIIIFARTKIYSIKKTLGFYQMTKRHHNHHYGTIDHCSFPAQSLKKPWNEQIAMFKFTNVNSKKRFSLTLENLSKHIDCEEVNVQFNPRKEM